MTVTDAAGLAPSSGSEPGLAGDDTWGAGLGMDRTACPSDQGAAETQRVAALESYRILDTPPEQMFDDLVEIVMGVLNVPIAAVNLVAADRQWSKSQIGLRTNEVPLEAAFCPKALHLEDTLVVPDAMLDPRFAESPLVTGPMHIRFYAGEVLYSREGQPLGTFCVADTSPRVSGLDARERTILKKLARQVVSHLEMRRTIIERDETVAWQGSIAPKHRSDASFLRSVLAASEDCIHVLDLAGRSEFMTENGMRAIGVQSYDEIRGTDWRRAWKDDGPLLANAAIEAVHHGRTGRFFGQAARTGHWWDVQLTPMLDAAGRLEKMLSVARDISVSRRAGEVLREAQALNTAILNASSDAIVVTDLDGIINYISPAGMAAMDIPSPEDAIGASWLHSWQEAYQPAAERAMIESRAGAIGRFHGCRPTHKGIPKWWDVVIAPLPDRDGNPERLVSVGRDISDLKLTEHRLASSQERLTLALGASSAVGVWDWDLRTNIIHCDRNFARMFGMDPELGGTGITLAEFARRYPPDQLPGFELARDRITAGADEHAREFRIVTPDGDVRWLMTRGRTIRSSDGTPLRMPGAAVDITERRLAEAALREANERLEERVAAALAEQAKIEEALRQSQKMEAVGQLTGGLAHDFNNLLASIGGALEIMQTRIAQGRVGNLGRYIDAAEGATRRASALTHRLLAFSRRQTLDPRPTDVNRLIAEMEDLLCRTVGPQTRLEVVGAEGLWSTLIDPNQLENALLNLCINARDAMPGGGNLVILTANQWIDEKAACEADVPVGHYASLSISDTGSGMPPDVVARAFDPFFTTKPLGMGTGLGLSMVYGFVRQSGGTVTIASEPGAGTLVRLYLPRHLGVPETVAPSVPAQAEALARAVANILVVDDEETLRGLVAEVLEECGYGIQQAGDGAAALKWLQSGVQIELLVTDVGLPGGMNGRQLADAGRRLRPGLKVLFITGYAENAAVGADNLEPGMQVLAKPFMMSTLTGRIEEMIAAG